MHQSTAAAIFAVQHSSLAAVTLRHVLHLLVLLATGNSDP